MNIASMVLGIISLIFCILCGCISMVTAPIGLILGIVDLVKNKTTNKPKGMAIAGVVMNGIALLIFVGLFLFGAAIGLSDSFYY